MARSARQPSRARLLTAVQVLGARTGLRTPPNRTPRRLCGPAVRGEALSRLSCPSVAGKPLDGKVSIGNYQMIRNALDGSLIEGVSIPNSKGEPTMLYRAPRGAAAGKIATGSAGP